MAFHWTTMRRAFVTQFCIVHNAAKAARAAGYSERSIYSISYDLMRMPDVVKAIEEETERLCMKREEVLLRLSQQAAADITDFVQEGTYPVINQKTGRILERPVVTLNWKNLKKMGHLVKSIHQNADGDVEVVLHDSQDAQELLGKHYRLFTDKIVEVEHLNVEGVNSQLDKVYGSDGNPAS